MGGFGEFDAEADLETLETMSDEEIRDFIEGPTQDFMPWGSLHDTIMESLLDGDEDWESESILILAKNLKVAPAELKEVLESANPQLTSQKRLEKLLERQQMSRLGYNWSNLETAVLQKLGALVKSGAIRTPDALLAVAKTANSAIRRGSTVGVPQMTEKQTNQNGVNINLNGGLPGAGSIGTISLTLSHRTVEQLRNSKVIEGDSRRLDDKIQMLGPEDVPEISKLVDGENG